MENGYNVFINIGQRQDGKVSHLNDLDDDSILDAIKDKIEEFGGVGECLQKASQVLVWDTETNHNLIAVYAIADEKLLTL